MLRHGRSSAASPVEITWSSTIYILTMKHGSAGLSLHIAKSDPLPVKYPESKTLPVSY